MEDIKTTISKILEENDIVLFMKGYKTVPQCGFSAFVANVLFSLGVKFKDVNVLEDENMRQGIKDYTNWPTIPMLYVNKEFIGGADIIRDLYKSGELQTILKKK